jgi:hypothetical protein
MSMILAFVLDVIKIQVYNQGTYMRLAWLCVCMLFCHIVHCIV